MPGPDGASQDEDQRADAADAPAPARVVRHHRRFALSEVTLDGQPVGGATIDAWENGAGARRWSARVLMPPGDWSAAGLLAGRLRDGTVLRGSVTLIGPRPTGRGRGAAMTEWHGTTPLRQDATDGHSER